MTKEEKASLEEALEEIVYALVGYMEDCIGSEEYKKEQKSLDKSWQLILNTIYSNEQSN